MLAINYSTEALITLQFYISRLPNRNCRHIITFLSSLRGRYCWPIGTPHPQQKKGTAYACAETWIFGCNWIIVLLLCDRCRSETSLQTFSSLHSFGVHRTSRHVRNG